MCQCSVYARHFFRIAYIKHHMPGYKLVEMWECDWDNSIAIDNSIIHFLKTTKIGEPMNIR